MTGLTQNEVIKSREKHGSNTLPKRKSKRILRMILENLCDPIIRILIGALILNLLFTYRNINWAESLGILAAVLIATTVSVLSERGGEKAFEKMNEMASGNPVTVMREGQWQQIPSCELVVGDCLLLGSGERVPCDARIASGELYVDQSALNGESVEVRKYPESGGDGSLLDVGMVHTGCMVLRGTAQLCVTGVGGTTLYGKIASELQSDSRESPMKLRLSTLAKIISRIGYVAALLVALLYVFSAFWLDCPTLGAFLSKCKDFSFVGATLSKALTIGITVIVVAVPEGLPMMLTVILSCNMRRMYKDKVLVRKPVGIETAGSMNILFCDKTGTMTTGNLTLENLFLGDLTRIGSPGQLKKYTEFSPYFSVQAHFNTESVWQGSTPILGNATERAILQFAGKTKPQGITVSKKIPFDSMTKYSGVYLDGMCNFLACYKGSPELLLPLCSSYLDERGRKQPLSDKKDIWDKIKEVSMAMGRVVLLCQSDSPGQDADLPNELTLVCLACMRDEIRLAVAPAIRKMSEAGVQTVMVTGDSRETAMAIATRCQLIQKGQSEAVLTSKEMAQMSDAELATYLPKLRVVARALPQDKSRLVRIAQERGLVVGMTGDGVNDAPALKMADIGFAMGSGTDVARQAGDIVILDCDFASIVQAVLYGRTIFQSVKKFIVFQLTMNLCAVGVSIFGQMVGIDTPVTVIQMLWVNIIMDTLGGLAFAGEAPLAFYMKQPPKRRDEPILSKDMIIKTLVMGGYTVFLSTLFLYSPRVRQMYGFASDPNRLLCAFFALFIFCGILISFCARSDRRGVLYGIGGNRAFLWIMALIFGIQMLMLYFGGATFRCVPLGVKEFLLPLGFSLTVLPIDALRRLFTLSHPK